jgi:hypothetical protein
MIPKVKPETFARLRAFADVLHTTIDKAIEAVKPDEVSPVRAAADDRFEDLMEVDHG